MDEHHRNILKLLARTRINGEARQLLDAIILVSIETGEAVTLTNSQIAELTLLENDGICRGRTALKRMNVVELIEARMNIVKGVWSYQLKDVSLWEVVAKRKIRKTANKTFLRKAKNVITKVFTR